MLDRLAEIGQVGGAPVDLVDGDEQTGAPGAQSVEQRLQARPPPRLRLLSDRGRHPEPACGQPGQEALAGPVLQVGRRGQSLVPQIRQHPVAGGDRDGNPAFFERGVAHRLERDGLAHTTRPADRHRPERRAQALDDALPRVGGQVAATDQNRRARPEGWLEGIFNHGHPWL